ARQATPTPAPALARAAVAPMRASTQRAADAALTDAAAATGEAILGGQPAGLDLTRAQQALATVAKKGVAFQIGFQRRFDSGYAEAKRRVEAGGFGRVETLFTRGG